MRNSCHSTYLKNKHVCGKINYCIKHALVHSFRMRERKVNKDGLTIPLSVFEMIFTVSDIVSVLNTTVSNCNRSEISWLCALLIIFAHTAKYV